MMGAPATGERVPVQRDQGVELESGVDHALVVLHGRGMVDTNLLVSG